MKLLKFPGIHPIVSLSQPFFSIFHFFFPEIDEMKKNEAKLFEDVERAKNEKRSAETTLEEVLKSRRNEDRNGEINQLQMR